MTPLRDLARDRQRRIGTALVTPTAQTDPRELALVAREYSSVTPENAMKWVTIHPARDRYEFAAADAVVDFATAHGMTVRGHTLATIVSSRSPYCVTTSTPSSVISAGASSSGTW